MFPGARIASHPPGVHLAFPLVGVPEELKSLVDNQNVYLGSSNQVSPGFRQSDDAGDALIFVRRDGEAHLNSFPVSHYGGEGEFMVVMLDFPNGDKLTEFIKLYLVSYVLGMLVRYHPSIWTSLLRNEKGRLCAAPSCGRCGSNRNRFRRALIASIGRNCQETTVREA